MTIQKLRTEVDAIHNCVLRMLAILNTGPVVEVPVQRAIDEYAPADLTLDEVAGLEFIPAEEELGR